MCLNLGTLWDNLRQFGRLFDEFGAPGKEGECFPSHFRPFSPKIGSLKQMRYGRMEVPTDGKTDRQTDAWTRLKKNVCYFVKVYISWLISLTDIETSIQQIARDPFFFNTPFPRHRKNVAWRDEDPTHAGRMTDRSTDRRTDRRTDGQTDGYTLI